MSFSRVVIEKMAYALPPQVVTSEQLEHTLDPLYERLNLQVGRLELMTGIKERRFWESNHKASQASAEAGVKLLEEGNIDPKEVDLLIDLFITSLQSEVHDLHKNNIKLLFFI